MSLSSSINDWNMIDCDSESKNSKLDIIIEYLKKNTLENNYLCKLDNLNKKIISLQKNQLLILEKLEKIEKQLTQEPPNTIDVDNNDNKCNISNELPEINDIYRLSNNIWRNNYPISSNIGLKCLTTPNLSLKHLNYSLDKSD